MYKPESYERHFGKYLFAKQHKYNTYLRKCPSEKVLIYLHLSEHRSIVTFTWTRPIQTQEIVLPPASPYIIRDIQCLRVTESSSSSSDIQQAVDCSPHPHKNPTPNTHTHPSLEVTTGVHMPSRAHICKKTLCPHLSAVRTVLTTHTGACTLHPCSVQPPTPLKAATLGACACESGSRLGSPHRRTPSAQGSEGNEGFRSSL